MSISSDSNWTSVIVNGNPEEWLPVMKFAISGLSIGISKHGAWLVGSSNECVPVDSGTATRILPILEMDPGLSKAQLINAIMNQAISPASLQGGIELPFLIAVQAAIEGNSEYWADLALDWLGTLTPSPEILESLEGLVNARWASQRTRHRAHRILHGRHSSQ